MLLLMSLTIIWKTAFWFSPHLITSNVATAAKAAVAIVHTATGENYESRAEIWLEYSAFAVCVSNKLRTAYAGHCGSNENHTY